jgi:hypothetical protein
VLIGWQPVVPALLSLPWLVLALVGLPGVFNPAWLDPAEGDTVGGMAFIAVVGLAAAALMITIATRNVVVLRPDSLWIGGEAVPYDQVVAVDVEPTDPWLDLVPLEAPALQVAGLRRRQTKVLYGLVGIRWPAGNRRVARQTAAIRKAARI